VELIKEAIPVPDSPIRLDHDDIEFGPIPDDLYKEMLAKIPVLEEEKRKETKKRPREKNVPVDHDDLKKLCAETKANTENAIVELKDQLQRMGGKVVLKDHKVQTSAIPRADIQYSTDPKVLAEILSSESESSDESSSSVDDESDLERLKRIISNYSVDLVAEIFRGVSSCTDIDDLSPDQITRLLQLDWDSRVSELLQSKCGDLFFASNVHMRDVMSSFLTTQYGFILDPDSPDFSQANPIMMKDLLEYNFSTDYREKLVSLANSLISSVGLEVTKLFWQHFYQSLDVNVHQEGIDLTVFLDYDFGTDSLGFKKKVDDQKRLEDLKKSAIEFFVLGEDKGLLKLALLIYTNGGNIFNSVDVTFFDNMSIGELEDIFEYFEKNPTPESWQPMFVDRLERLGRNFVRGDLVEMMFPDKKPFCYNWEVFTTEELYKIMMYDWVNDPDGYEKKLSEQKYLEEARAKLEELQRVNEKIQKEKAAKKAKKAEKKRQREEDERQREEQMQQLKDILQKKTKPDSQSNSSPVVITPLDPEPKKVYPNPKTPVPLTSPLDNAFLGTRWKTLFPHLSLFDTDFAIFCRLKGMTTETQYGSLGKIAEEFLQTEILKLGSFGGNYFIKRLVGMFSKKKTDEIKTFDDFKTKCKEYLEIIWLDIFSARGQFTESSKKDFRTKFCASQDIRDEQNLKSLFSSWLNK
jgi:hypothetical protein